MTIGAQDLRPNRGATQSKKRVGRGNSAGGGTYAGKGLKGQKSRSGPNVRVAFEGGQTPLARKMRVLRGFSNARFKVVYQPVNVGQLERFEAGSSVDPESLKAAGMLKHLREPVKVLAFGDLTRKLNVTAHRFSEAAKAKIEQAGGTATVIAAAESTEG
jgi:large subunit ribosomal protein L15